MMENPVPTVAIQSEELEAAIVIIAKHYLIYGAMRLR